MPPEGASEFVRDVRRMDQRRAREDDARARRMEADLHRSRSRRSERPIYDDELESGGGFGSGIGASFRKHTFGEKREKPLLGALFGAPPEAERRRPRRRDEFDEPERRRPRPRPTRDEFDDFEDGPRRLRHGPPGSPRRSGRYADDAPEDFAEDDRPRRRDRPIEGREAHRRGRSIDDVEPPRRRERERMEDEAERRPRPRPQRRPEEYEDEPRRRPRRRNPDEEPRMSRMAEPEEEVPRRRRADREEEQPRRSARPVMDDPERPRRSRIADDLDAPSPAARPPRRRDDEDAPPRRPRREPEVFDEEAPRRPIKSRRDEDLAAEYYLPRETVPIVETAPVVEASVVETAPVAVGVPSRPPRHRRQDVDEGPVAISRSSTRSNAADPASTAGAADVYIRPKQPRPPKSSDVRIAAPGAVKSAILDDVYDLPPKERPSRATKPRVVDEEDEVYLPRERGAKGASRRALDVDYVASSPREQPPRSSKSRIDYDDDFDDVEEDGYSVPPSRSGPPKSSRSRIADAEDGYGRPVRTSPKRSLVVDDEPRASRGDRVRRLKEVQEEHKRKKDIEARSRDLAEEDAARDVERYDSGTSFASRNVLRDESEDDEEDGDDYRRPANRGSSRRASPSEAVTAPPLQAELSQHLASRKAKLSEEDEDARGSESPAPRRASPPVPAPRSLVQSAQRIAQSETPSRSPSPEPVVVTRPKLPPSRGSSDYGFPPRDTPDVKSKPVIKPKPKPKPKPATVLPKEEDEDEAAFLSAARSKLKAGRPPQPTPRTYSPDDDAESDSSLNPPVLRSKPLKPPRSDQGSPAAEVKEGFEMPKLRSPSPSRPARSTEEPAFERPSLRPPQPRKVSTAKPSEAVKKLQELRAVKPVVKPPADVPEAVRQRMALKAPKPSLDRDDDASKETFDARASLRPPRSNSSRQNVDPNMAAITEQLRQLKPRSSIASGDLSPDEEQDSDSASISSRASGDSLSHAGKGRAKGPKRRPPTYQ